MGKTIYPFTKRSYQEDILKETPNAILVTPENADKVVPGNGFTIETEIKIDLNKLK